MAKARDLYVFVDVDDTIIKGAGDLNLSLIDVIRCTPNIRKLWLLTSYSLHWNTLNNTSKNALRVDVIRRLERYGLEPEFVITSASPYTSLDKFTYFNEVVAPIEKKCREEWLKFPQREKIVTLLSQHQNTIDEEIALINECIVEEKDIKGGKQHILEFSVSTCPPNCGVVFFDDKPEVIKVTKNISTQYQYVAQNNIILKEHLVNFKYLDEGRAPYEESMQIASGCSSSLTPSSSSHAFALSSSLEELDCALLPYRSSKVIVTLIFIEEHLLFDKDRSLNPIISSLCRQSIGIFIMTSNVYNEQEKSTISMRLSAYQITLLDIQRFDLNHLNPLTSIEFFAHHAGVMEKRYTSDPLHFIVISSNADFLTLVKNDYSNDPAIACVLLNVYNNNNNEVKEEDVCHAHLKSCYAHELRLLSYLLEDNPKFKPFVDQYNEDLHKIADDKFPYEFACRAIEELRSFLYSRSESAYSVIDVIRMVLNSDRKYFHSDSAKHKKKEKVLFKRLCELIRSLEEC